MVKFLRILTYVGDCLAVLQMILFSLYTYLLLDRGIGDPKLNIAILILTGFYIIFLFVKIFVLNRLGKRAKKISAITKKSYKYTRAILKIITAGVVVVAIINNRSLDGNVLAFVGLCFMIFAFIVSVLVDIALFLIKHNIRKRKDKIAGVVTGVKDKFSALTGKTGAESGAGRTGKAVVESGAGRTGKAVVESGAGRTGKAVAESGAGRTNRANEKNGGAK